MTSAAVLEQPDVPVDDMALLKALRARLGTESKTHVMNAVGCILRDAFAAVGFGFKQCFNYAPLIHERQVACVWLLELNDDLAIAAAAAEVAGTDAEPREIPNMAVRVKIVFKEVDGTTQAGEFGPGLRCSLSMMVPGFEQFADPATPEPWLERELLGVTISREGEVVDVVERAEATLLAAIHAEKRPGIVLEAQKLSSYVLRGLAP